MTYEYKVYESEEELERSLELPFDSKTVDDLFREIYLPIIADQLNSKNLLSEVIKHENPSLRW